MPQTTERRAKPWIQEEPGDGRPGKEAGKLPGESLFRRKGRLQVKSYLHVQFGKSLRVCCVHPGLCVAFATKMQPAAMAAAALLKLQDEPANTGVE